MKSKYIGTIINDCEVLESRYKINKTGKSGGTYFILKCLKCGNTFERPMFSVAKKYARCKCTYNSGCKENINPLCHFKLSNTYRNMMSRCYNPNDKSYKNYGIKGIKVCDEWLDSYDNFESWALSNGYELELTIHRLDNNKGYNPENCRWVTKSFNSGCTSRFGKDKIENYHPKELS